MCYDIKASLKTQLSKAERSNDDQAIEEIKEKLIPQTDLPLFHGSGFDHPKLLIYTDVSPDFPDVATWGLIPNWVRDIDKRNALWNKTLNARGETMLDMPSFRDSAEHQRCVIYVDGFYEHHHFKGKTYPYFIYHKDHSPLVFAGLWSSWRNPEDHTQMKTFTIVTTTGNAMMAAIHNNPKLDGPRMPLILTPTTVDDWLGATRETPDVIEDQERLRTYPEELLEAHTVARLRGKTYPGNVESISNRHTYPELQFPGGPQQMSLF